MIDYSALDHPSILRYVFYPRRDFTVCPERAFDFFVDVGGQVSISCRFYVGRHEWPWILYFHGNGEVVSDYDELAPFYHQKKLNLVVADYRGYGASSGIPTLTDLVQDSQVIFIKIREELAKRNLRDDLLVMGRSLGSISALELAYEHQDVLRGLIIDSGFPSVVRIITHLGIPAYGIDLDKIDQLRVERIARILIPSLIIHGGQDSLVPLQNARDLYDHLGGQDKELLVIPSATHNDIMIAGFNDYFKAIQRFVEKTDRINAGS